MTDEKCTAAANLKGEHIPCDEPAGHRGWAHGSRQHGLIWDGPLGQRDWIAEVAAENQRAHLMLTAKDRELDQLRAQRATAIADIQKRIDEWPAHGASDQYIRGMRAALLFIDGTAYQPFWSAAVSGQGDER